jgi:D-alanyl-D-alanine dipeptidase
MRGCAQATHIRGHTSSQPHTQNKHKLNILKKYILLVLMILAAACGQPPAAPKENTVSGQTDTIVVTQQDSINRPVDSITRQDDDQPVTDKMTSPEKASPEKDFSPVHPAATVISPAGGNRYNFKAVRDLDPSIRLDIRYATANNFTKVKIYDCAECLLRPEAAAALVTVHQALQAKGYGGLKMFDCYRPRPYQQRLWDKVPNPNYVTPPAKGSMHSRGAAVDLTIVDKNGKELDMGTPYDFFGVEAHFDYRKLPPAVLSNRRMFRTMMEAAGFEGIRTEWWHFSYRKGSFPLSDFLWKCE